MVENIVLYPQHVARLLKIRDKIYTKVATLSCKAALSKEPIKKDMLDKAEFVDYETGMVWGSKFDCAWFKFEGDVPESCKGKHIVADIILLFGADRDRNLVLYALYKLGVFGAYRIIFRG